MAWLRTDVVAVEPVLGEPLRRGLQEQDREGQDRGHQEEPARLLLAVDAVGDLAAEEVAQAQPAEQDADDARPAVDARPEVPRHQPPGHHLQRHERQAGHERQDRQVAQARPGRAPAARRRPSTSAAAASLAAAPATRRSAPSTARTSVRACPTSARGLTSIEPERHARGPGSTGPAARSSPSPRHAAARTPTTAPGRLPSRAAASRARAAATTVTIVEVGARYIRTKPARNVPTIEPTAPQK